MLFISYINIPLLELGQIQSPHACLLLEMLGQKNKTWIVMVSLNVLISYHHKYSFFSECHCHPHKRFSFFFFFFFLGFCPNPLWIDYRGFFYHFYCFMGVKRFECLGIIFGSMPSTHDGIQDIYIYIYMHVYYVVNGGKHIGPSFIHFVPPPMFAHSSANKWRFIFQKLNK